MPYEDFKPSDPVAFKIIQNAKEFGVDLLENENLLSEFLKTATTNLKQEEREKIEEIFVKLMKIEEDVQLSK
ncbi:MAG: acetyltransferase [Campylobacter sp.]|nr:acetyltransferase [Campylobacter sp.]